MRAWILCLLLSSAPALAESQLYLVADLAGSSPDPALRAQSAVLQDMFDTLAERAAVEATLLYSDSQDINAFATEVGDTRIVVVNRGLLDLLEHDRDAVAAVLGHELAHHKADHVRAGHRKQQGIKLLGAVLGAVVGAKLGDRHGQLAGAVGGAAVGVGATLVALKFNRNQELEADRLSVAWLAQGDFQPQGMLRLQSAFADLGAGRASLFDTHPRSEKRLKAAEQLVASLPAATASGGISPLVDASALALAEADIAQAQSAALARALQDERPGEPDAAALAPVEGIDFDQYAALNNRLIQGTDADKPAVLREYHLDEAAYQRVSDAFNERMRETPELAAHYSPAYLRASLGPLAAHGRDVADSISRGQPLALDPPYPLESAVAMLRAVHEGGAFALEGEARTQFEAQVMAPHGITLYDFAIGHNWWMRKARIDAVLGDYDTMQSLASAFQAPAQRSEQAGVSIGKGVSMGDNVRIGGRPAQTQEAVDSAQQTPLPEAEDEG